MLSQLLFQSTFAVIQYALYQNKIHLGNINVTFKIRTNRIMQALKNMFGSCRKQNGYEVIFLSLRVAVLGHVCRTEKDDG